MVDRAIAGIVSRWERDGIVAAEDRDIYIYGLDLIFSTIVNVATLCILSVILGCFVPTILYLAVILPMQVFGGGYHADTHLRCFSLMVVTWWIIVPHVPTWPLWAGIGILVVSCAVISRLAPVPNVHVPMSEGHRKKMRNIARILCIGFVVAGALMVAFHLVYSRYVIAGLCRAFDDRRTREIHVGLRGQLRLPSVGMLFWKFCGRLVRASESTACFCVINGSQTRSCAMNGRFRVMSKKSPPVVSRVAVFVS